MQTNITCVCGECLQCLGHIRFARAHGMCAFPVYTAQAPGCSAGEVSKACPGLRALPRSKPLRFRFSGTPQRHRLGLCFVPFPGLSSSGVQVLCERTTSGVPYVLSPPQSQSLGFLGSPQEHHLRCVMYLLWGADLWLRPSWQMSAIQDPRQTWLATGSLLSLVEDAISGARIAPILLALAVVCLPLCLQWGMAQSTAI